MTTKEKYGLGVIAVLFLVFGVVLYLSVKPLSDSAHKPEDSYFVQQRVKILKSRQ
ncbi:MAG: hypothetical protein HYV27_19460 [Candidatus Hydrogenedentes bacterium]|nr:hypothetical protein [Candidatus Hydrogenedentota bacterium]